MAEELSGELKKLHEEIKNWKAGMIEDSVHIVYGTPKIVDYHKACRLDGSPIKPSDVPSEVVEKHKKGEVILALPYDWPNCPCGLPTREPSFIDFSGVAPKYRSCDEPCRKKLIKELKSEE